MTSGEEEEGGDRQSQCRDSWRLNDVACRPVGAKGNERLLLSPSRAWIPTYLTLLYSLGRSSTLHPGRNAIISQRILYLPHLDPATFTNKSFSPLQQRRIDRDLHLGRLPSNQ